MFIDSLYYLCWSPAAFYKFAGKPVGYLAGIGYCSRKCHYLRLRVVLADFRKHHLKCCPSFPIAYQVHFIRYKEPYVIQPLCIMAEKSIHLFICKNYDVCRRQFFSRRVIVASCGHHLDLSAKIKILKDLYVVILFTRQGAKRCQIYCFSILFKRLVNGHHCDKCLAASSWSSHEQTLSFQYAMLQCQLLRRIERGIAKMRKKCFD